MGFFDDYDIFEKIGEGSYGKVYLASRKGKKAKDYVAKFFDIEAINKVRLKNVDRRLKRGDIDEVKAAAQRRVIITTPTKDMEKEVAMLERLNALGAPNIVTYVTHYADVEYEKGEFWPRSLPKGKYFVIIMERVFGFDLSTLVKCFVDAKSPKIPKAFVRKMTLDLLRTLVYLHNRDIVHRDIKTANVMYDARRRRIKYIDFGYSCFTDLSPSSPKSTVPSLKCERRNIGSHGSYAPEMLRGAYKTKPLSMLKGVDVWALGVTLFRLENLERPFRNDDATLENVRKKSSGPDAVMNEIIEMMLTYDYEKRPTAKDVLEYFEDALARGR